MATATRTDPLRNFKFLVQITPRTTGGLSTHVGSGELPRLGFAEMSGLSVTNELIAYREGGMNTHPHKMIGQSDFPPVSFSRGVFAEQDQMWKWQTFMHSWQQGVSSGSQGLDSDYRCDILVKVYDHPFTNSSATYLDADIAASDSTIKPGTARLGFKLFNCWPGVFAMNGLNAGDNGILIQQMTIHHEGFQIAWDTTSINNLAATS
jgi:phage tail-like protein